MNKALLVLALLMLGIGQITFSQVNNTRQARITEGVPFNTIFAKVAINPASNHFEGGKGDPEDGFAKLQLTPAYQNRVKEIVYHVHNQTDFPELNPKIVVKSGGEQVFIPNLRYAAYDIIEVRLKDGSILPVDNGKTLNVFSAGAYAMPRGNIAEFTKDMEGPNMSAFVHNFNAVNSANFVPLSCNSGTWTVTWTSQGSQGGAIIVAKNSCGQKFIFECIQHNGPGLVAGQQLSSNGGNPCNATLILTPFFPGQTYRALPITPYIITPGCIQRNPTTGAPSNVSFTAWWDSPNAFTYPPQSELPVTFSWSNGATGTTMTTSQAGTYTVNMTMGPCTFSASATVGKNGYAGQGQSVNVCANAGTLNLNNYLSSGADAGGTWQRSSGTGGTFNAASGTFNPSGATSSVFSYTASGTSGCTPSYAYITVNPTTISVSASATSINCSNATATLTATASGGSAPYSYSWTGPNGFTASGPSATTNAAGTYTVTATSGTCSGQATVAVTSAGNGPVVSLSGNNPICSNSTVTLTASVQNGTGQAPFTYVFRNNMNAILQSDTSNTLTIMPAGISSVNVTVTDANGCSTTQSINVNTPGPALTLTNIVSICRGQSTTLQADNGGISGYTYFWTDNSMTNPIRTVTPDTSTNYTVVRTTGQGCKDTATSTVNVFSKPAIQNVALTNPGCGSSTGSIVVTATGNASQLQYRINSGAWQTSNTFSNLAAGSYTITVGNVNAVCNDTTTPPQVLTPSNNISSGINGPSARCADEDMQFQVQPPVAGATYQWSATGNPIVTNGSANNNYITRWAASQSGTQQTVTLVVTKNGCTATYTHDVSITGAISANAGPDKAMCPASQVTIGTVPSFSSGGTTPFATYSWSPAQYVTTGANAAQAVVAPPVTTTFTLTVTDPVNGCTKTDQVTVVVSVAINPTADAGPDQNIPVTGNPGAVQLGGPGTTQQGAEPNTNISYLWTAVAPAPINALNNTGSATPTFTRPVGTAAGTTYKYVLMVQKQYVSPSANAGVTCPVYDTVSITIGAAAPALCIKLRAYLEGALMNNGGQTAPDGRPLMRDNLRSSPFTGQNYIPSSDPYQVATTFVNVTSKYNQVAPGNSPAFSMVSSPSVFTVSGQDAIVDWVFVELRDKNNPSAVVATRSGFVQRDGDIVDVDGVSCLSFPNVAIDSYYVAVRHRSHLGTMTKFAQSATQLQSLVDFTVPATPIFDYGTSHSNLDYTGLGEKPNASGTYRALWSGDADVNKKVRYGAPVSDADVVQTDVLFFPGNTAFDPFYDFAFGYFQGDIDMNSKARFEAPGADAEYIQSQVLFYPLNTAFDDYYDFLIEQLP